MFILLLVVTFVIALTVCYIVVRLFNAPIDAILRRIIPDEISQAWSRYLKFAIYVVGISGGVRVWDLEQYILRRSIEAEILTLTTERWILEVYRTIIGTLQSTAMVLLVFFIFALIAYVIVRAFESRRPQSEQARV